MIFFFTKQKSAIIIEAHIDKAKKQPQTGVGNGQKIRVTKGWGEREKTGGVLH